MSVGIEDADFNQYILVPFNLEVMKLSAYYKKHNEIVVLAPSFVPEKHRLFIYRKDYEDGSYPPKLLSTPNVEFGGLAFSNNKYEPLAPEIERMRPDTSIYARAETLIMRTKSPLRKKIYGNMVEAEHCRLSLDGKTIWSDFNTQFRYLAGARNLMLHDYDLGKVEGSFSVVKDILSRARNDGWATKVGMKFPINISDGQSLLDWSSLNTNSTFYSLRFNGMIPNDAFLKWVGQCRQRAVYSQMEYFVTAPQYTENQFTQVILPQIFRQVIISRSFRVFFSLKYDEEFFSDKNWIQVLRLINFYMNSMSGIPVSQYIMKDYDDTMIAFAQASNTRRDRLNRHYADSMTRQEIRNVFAFVRENNYNLFKDFYECSARSLGGKL